MIFFLSAILGSISPQRAGYGAIWSLNIDLIRHGVGEGAALIQTADRSIDSSGLEVRRAKESSKGEGGVMRQIRYSSNSQRAILSERSHPSSLSRLILTRQGLNNNMMVEAGRKMQRLAVRREFARATWSATPYITVILGNNGLCRIRWRSHNLQRLLWARE